MDLEVVLPTYNRCNLLKRALNSLLAAYPANGLQVKVAVIDNNSTDSTATVVKEWRESTAGRLKVRYVLEGRQGKSYALNRGIASSDADLIGLIDDDEEVEPHWFQRIAEAFESPTTDFIGGPCRPNWGAPVPDWLPPNFTGPIQSVELSDHPRAYDEAFPGILMGGNAVLRRVVFEKTGPFSTLVNRKGNGLLSGVDEEFYRRVLDEGFRGIYLPDLVIYHYVPRERLTKRYFRRWSFWHAVATTIQYRSRRPPMPHLMGIPRWHVRSGFAGLITALRGALSCTVTPGVAFESELKWIHLIGLLYGRWFFRVRVEP
jgi:glycosyltransferase involved in cell wall biosynthesis